MRFICRKCGKGVATTEPLDGENRCPPIASHFDDGNRICQNSGLPTSMRTVRYGETWPGRIEMSVYVVTATSAGEDGWGRDTPSRTTVEMAFLNHDKAQEYVRRRIEQTKGFRYRATFRIESARVGDANTEETE